jgi:WD40 repeat protein
MPRFQIMLAALVAIGSAAAATADEPAALFVMQVDGTGVRRVADVDRAQLGDPRWSHDGAQLAFDAADGASRRWYLVHSDGSRQRTFGLGACPDWSPDDKQLVFSVDGGAGAAPGVWVQNFDGQGRVALADAGRAPRWSPSGGTIALLVDETLVVLDLIDSQQRKLDVPGGILPGFNWSPDGKRIAFVAQAEKQRELWLVGVQDSNKQKLLSGDFDGCVSWSPDGKRLAISIGGQVNLLEVAGGEPQPVPGQEGVNRMPAWSPDGKSIAFVSTRTTPARMPVAQARRKVQFEEVRRHSRGAIVYGFDMSLDGRHALLGGKRDLELWNLENDETSRLDLRGEWVALSPDGHTVALCGPLIKVTLGDLQTGKPLRDLHAGSMCTNADFSSDGKLLVCGTIDKEVQVWDVASGKRIHVFKDHQAPITRVAFLPGGEVTSNGQDQHTRVWDAATGKQRLALNHPDVPWGLAITTDGRLIATGTGGHTEGNPIMHRMTKGVDHVIRLWDAASGQVVRELKGHTDMVYALAFSADGRTLVSGGWDGAIRVWDVATGTELAKAQGQGSVHALGITPDGSQVVVGGGENRSAGAPIRRYRDEQVRLYRIIEER